MLTNAIFHHVGIATDCIEKTVLEYMNLGYAKSELFIDIIQNVNILFLKKGGSSLLELVEPREKSSPVYNIVKKNGVTPYHLCYEVLNIEECISSLKKRRYVPLSKPVQAIAFDNRRICFLYNKYLGLIELLEK